MDEIDFDDTLNTHVTRNNVQNRPQFQHNLQPETSKSSSLGHSNNDRHMEPGSGAKVNQMMAPGQSMTPGVENFFNMAGGMNRNQMQQMQMQQQQQQSNLIEDLFSTDNSNSNQRQNSHTVSPQW